MFSVHIDRVSKNNKNLYFHCRDCKCITEQLTVIGDNYDYLYCINCFANFSDIYDFDPNKLCQDTNKYILIKCKYAPKCSVELNLCKINSHDQNCEYRQVPCDYDGCYWSGCFYKLKEHLSQHKIQPTKEDDMKKLVEKIEKSYDVIRNELDSLKEELDELKRYL